MSRLWHDPAAWAAHQRQETCPICRAGIPRDVIATVPSGWVTMADAAPLRGYCVLVARRHVVELHELTRAEGAAFMHDAQRLAAAVQAVTGAIKLNYEIHGNTLPHLHLHLFPRYPGDPFVGGPIDPRRAVPPAYASGEFAALRRALQAALGAAD